MVQPRTGIIPCNTRRKRRVSLLDQLTETDNAAANWLPALEQWDWTRPDQKFDNGHWMMYTRGLNAGGIGGDNKSALKTEIYLTR